MKLTIKQKRFADEYIISGNAYGIVYKITNLINGKSYVGITTRTLKQRFKEHCNADSGIGRAIRKYGKENFKKEIIDYADDNEELLELEIEHIKKYDSYKNGYNNTLGGEGFHICQDLDINLTNIQKKYLEYVKRENKKTPDVNDSYKMLKIILMNLIDIYLVSKKMKEKISISKLILKLKPNLLQIILDTKLLKLEEIKHYASQNISSFEVFGDG